MKFKFFQYSIILVLLLLFFVVAGCGKKGPPLPPEDKTLVLNIPYDVACNNNQGFLVVNWKYDFKQKDSDTKLEGFNIFMAKNSLKDCDGCPVVFNKIDYVDDSYLDYTMHVEKGYRYYFRVQAESENSIKSEYSNTVKFEY